MNYLSSTRTKKHFALVAYGIHLMTIKRAKLRMKLIQGRKEPREQQVTAKSLITEAWSPTSVWEINLLSTKGNLSHSIFIAQGILIIQAAYSLGMISKALSGRLLPYILPTNCSNT